MRPTEMSPINFIVSISRPTTTIYKYAAVVRKHRFRWNRFTITFVTPIFIHIFNSWAVLGVHSNVLQSDNQTNHFRKNCHLNIKFYDIFCLRKQSRLAINFSKRKFHQIETLLHLMEIVRKKLSSTKYKTAFDRET